MVLRTLKLPITINQHMNRNNILIVLFFLLIITSYCNGLTKKGGIIGDQSADNGNNLSYAEKSKAVYDLIVQKYWDAKTGFFHENYPAKSDDKKACYLWSYVGVVSGTNTMMRIGYSQQELLPVVDGFANFLDPRFPAGYASYPVSLGHDTRFYDDNAITGIELVDAFQISGDKKYLEQAELAMDFIMTGEDTTCGGGVLWNETEGKGVGEKGISANGFSVYLALKLYQINNKKLYLDYANRIYKWVKTNLQNPDNLIYWNGIYVKDCSVNKAIWTYNTAIMILNDIEFYKLTNDKSFLKDASQMGASSYKDFTSQVDGMLFYTTHDTWFNTVLLKAYIELTKYDDKAKQYVETFIENADYAWEHARNQYGLFYEDWSGKSPGRDQWLLHEACLIEVYGRIALYRNEKVH